VEEAPALDGVRAMTDKFNEAAQTYRDNHHWVPLRLRGKSPDCMGQRWQKRTLADPVPEFAAGDNIGILLGDPSGGLVRIDPDFTSIAEVTKILFPEPSLVFGRASSPGSGRLFVCPGLRKSKDFRLPSSLKEDHRLPLHDGKPNLTVLQILSTGKQTMAPPSVHPDGEEVVWQSPPDTKIKTLDAPELIRRAGIEAFLLVVRQFWPGRGTRNEAAMALARVLLAALAARYPDDEERITVVDELVLAVAMEGGDGEESRDGKERAAATLEKMRAGEETTGLTRLVELMDLPESVGKTFRKWLGLVNLIGGNDARRAEQMARNIEIGDDVTEPIFPTVMTLAEMHVRLVFIGSIGAVADRATGRIRKKEHAADEYAASKHAYEDGDRNKTVVVPALRLWIESRERVTVDVLTWVPGRPQICRPPEQEGTGFNSWRGLTPMDAPEDWEKRATPFLDHVAFLVPVESERKRFLQWLAHIVQRPEVLPHTMYLMTTTTTGIGRNLLASILVRVLRGHVAAGVSLPELLDGGFTGRLSKKLLATVDEAREGSGERRYQRAERLKSILTEDYRHINIKYGLQSVEKNCCRWLMFSNHDDAIPFDNSDRRVIVISNPTERRSDEYYAQLYGMLDDGDFIASVRRWLEVMDIADFRAGEHAPMNEAKMRALHEMMTETERAVAEFKEDCATQLASRNLIRDHVSWSVSGNLNEAHLTHAIRRAGMINVERRVTAKGGTRHRVVIVRGGPWTVDAVKGAADATLLVDMGIGS
jgi:Family of unknown function (DUF5906)/Bifunctional DNA primase/polymerase, N-terminal